MAITTLVNNCQLMVATGVNMMLIFSATFQNELEGWMLSNSFVH